jgi:predicted phosphodiesterase
MRLLVLSDLHLEACGFTVDKAALKKSDVVVLAGDIHPGVNGLAWARKAFGATPIVYVAGNHELWHGHWEQTLQDLRVCAQEHDVHFLEEDAVTIDGVRFLGCSLWSDYAYFGMDSKAEVMHRAGARLPDYTQINVGVEGEVGSGLLTPELTVQRHVHSLAWLNKELRTRGDRSTVVVTHHYPHKNSCSPKFAGDQMTAAFGSKLAPELLQQANLWIHGHTHSSCNYRLGDSRKYVRVVSNPRGTSFQWFSNEFENSQFDPGFRMELLDDGNWGQAV